MVDLEVDGALKGQRDRRIVAVRNAAITADIGNGSESVLTRYLAEVEDAEANWNVDGSPNDTGWFEDLDKWLRLLQFTAASVVAGGETNTASNVGGFAEAFKQKTTFDLEFRTFRSFDSSITINQNDSNLSFVINEVGGAAFNGVTYTWPGTSGTSGYQLQTDGAGTLSWVAPSGNPQTVTTFADNVTQDLTVGTFLDDAMVIVHLSLYQTSTGASSNYTVKIAVSDTDIGYQVEKVCSNKSITTVAVTALRSGADILVRLTGSGVGTSTDATHELTRTFPK
jgi:hypothetical protein